MSAGPRSCSPSGTEHSPTRVMNYFHGRRDDWRVDRAPASTAREISTAIHTLQVVCRRLRSCQKSLFSSTTVSLCPISELAWQYESRDTSAAPQVESDGREDL